jgi:hypothetical protein
MIRLRKLPQDMREVTLGEMTNMSIDEPKKPTPFMGGSMSRDDINILTCAILAQKTDDNGSRRGA